MEAYLTQSGSEYLIDAYGSDKASWENFLLQPDAQPDIEVIKAFLLACARLLFSDW
ncbi:MAG: hypothetical protein V7L14_32920 [Nostoc sp.]|uniref:hypothetical protein n=1 Tax=Nostoc sp. TaxID=1180 RepID=UPI002FF628AA